MNCPQCGVKFVLTPQGEPVLSSPEILDGDGVPARCEISGGTNDTSNTLTLHVGTPLAEAEIRMILATLKKIGGNKRLCAQLLEISSRTLYRRLRGRSFCRACSGTRDLPHSDSVACSKAAGKERSLVERVVAATRATVVEDCSTVLQTAETVGGRPAWTTKESARTVWMEDDADVSAQGHETLERAFKRHYGVITLKPVETWDGGDAVFKLLPAGIVVIDSYPGNSEIRELPMPKAAKPGVCCACGFSGEEETACLRRPDRQHCQHWWEGADEGAP